MIKYFITLSITFFSFSSIADCISKTEKIYENIISSIGIKFPMPPELIFADTEKSVAYISKKGIVIEKKLINLFCGEKDFEAKIGYVIAHELAHHYLNHNWMKGSGLVYNNSSIGDFFYDQSKDKDQRKIAESQADLFGGFYGQIAGYNVLPYAEETLRKIYEVYDIPIESDLYPDLEERVTIINSNLSQAETLKEFFELGNVLMSGNSFVKAKDCYEDILKNNFSSREILNNLGLVYLKFGISISDEKISKLVFPLFLDQNTRLSTERTRSGSFSNDPKELFEKSISLFENAVDLDREYTPAKQNLFVARYLASNEDRRYRILEDIEDSELSDIVKTDFKVIDMILNDEKVKKISKLAISGSEISKMNLSENKDNSTFNSDLSILNSFGIDNSEYIMGFNRPFKTLKSSNGSLRVRKKSYDENVLYNFEGVLILKTLNDQYENYIYLNDHYYYIFNLE